MDAQARLQVFPCRFPKKEAGPRSRIGTGAPPPPFLTRSSCRCVSAGMAGNGSPRDLPSASGTFKPNPEANSCRRRKLVHSPLVAPELLHFPGPSLEDSASRGPLNTPHSFALSPGASCPDTQLCSHRGREAKWEEEETRLRPDRGPELDLLLPTRSALPSTRPKPRPSTTPLSQAPPLSQDWHWSSAQAQVPAVPFQPEQEGSGILAPSCAAASFARLIRFFPHTLGTTPTNF